MTDKTPATFAVFSLKLNGLVETKTGECGSFETENTEVDLPSLVPENLREDKSPEPLNKAVTMPSKFHWGKASTGAYRTVERSLRGLLFDNGEKHTVFAKIVHLMIHDGHRVSVTLCKDKFKYLK